MKNKICICLLMCLWSVAVSAQYNIQLQVKQMPEKPVILAHYFDGKIYAADTAQLNASGKGCFQHPTKKLAKGIYLLLFSPSNYFDLIIGDQQDFSLQTDTIHVLESL